MRRFLLIRTRDVHGKSGNGPVIWGVQWPDGRVSYRWNTETATFGSADSMADFCDVHVAGHEGGSHLLWVDPEAADQRWTRAGPPPAPGPDGGPQAEQRVEPTTPMLPPDLQDKLRDLLRLGRQLGGW